MSFCVTNRAGFLSESSCLGGALGLTKFMRVFGVLNFGVLLKSVLDVQQTRGGFVEHLSQT